MAAARHPLDVDVPAGTHQPHRRPEVQDLPVTAAQRWAAAYMTLALSQRISRLHEIDKAVYIGRHSKP